MACASLFCTVTHQSHDSGFVLPSIHDLDEENVDDYLRRSNNVTVDMGRESGKNVLVEGELEPLLLQASRIFDFTMSPAIMRLPEIPCRDSSCADRREDALAFMMLTHGRLGEASVLHHLSENVLELVVKEAMARPWGIFRRDVYFEDFLGLVARHVHAHKQNQNLHKVVLSKHSFF